MAGLKIISHVCQIFTINKLGEHSIQLDCLMGSNRQRVLYTLDYFREYNLTEFSETEALKVIPYWGKSTNLASHFFMQDKNQSYSKYSGFTTTWARMKIKTLTFLFHEWIFPNAFGLNPMLG